LSRRPGSFRALRVALIACLFAAASWTQGIVRPFSEVKFDPDDDVKCLQSTVESGDPAKGPSTIILKAPAGCLVPWHYHTAEEQLIVVRGNVRTEMDGMAAKELGPGGFAMMPGKAKHQFSCAGQAGCVMFVTFNRAYDIFWVHNKTK
jgi:quercetin dioxygenase-like cupin family protein